MKKTDLSKYLKLTPEDQRALGIQADSPDPYKAVVKVLPSKPTVVPRPVGKAPELGMPYIMGSCKHRVSLRERTDVKSVWIGNNLYTPHTCLACKALMWRIHPGPRRLRRFREDEAA